MISTDTESSFTHCSTDGTQPALYGKTYCKSNQPAKPVPEPEPEPDSTTLVPEPVSTTRSPITSVATTGGGGRSHTAATAAAPAPNNGRLLVYIGVGAAFVGVAVGLAGVVAGRKRGSARHASELMARGPAVQDELGGGAGASGVAVNVQINACHYSGFTVERREAGE